MRSVSLAAAAGSLVLSVSALTACGSSAGHSDSPGTSPSASRPGGASTGAQPSVAGSGNPADLAAIARAYTTFFDAKTPLDRSEAVLQDGAAFASVLTASAQTQYADQASAQVSKVVVSSPDRATVTFSILLNGSPILPDQTGYAVRENGNWKVAGATFCALLTAEGKPPAICVTPAATALPG